MGAKTGIEWTATYHPDGTITPGATWVILTGCEEDGPECANCYAVLGANRMGSNPNPKLSDVYKELTTRKGSQNKLHWNGNIRLLWERMHWPSTRFEKGCKVFVTSMGDLHHSDVPQDFLLAVYTEMENNPDKTFQVLTKRPQNLRRWINEEAPRLREWKQWPLPNVWVGTTVGRQQSDWRIDELLQVHAAIRFLSCEPLLGPLDITRAINRQPCGYYCDEAVGHVDHRRIDWVICGGESGPYARPMHPEWARSLRRQCQSLHIPFFFKQWGNWVQVEDFDPDRPTNTSNPAYQFLNLAGGQGYHGEKVIQVRKVDKKVAGRLLDGRTWDEMPDAGSVPLFEKAG